MFTKMCRILVLLVLSCDFLQGAIPASERAALIALYNSTNGDSWTNKTGWKTPPLYTDGFALPGTEGSWYGITVSGDTVIKITLTYNLLNGSIPAELGNLGNLTALMLYGNRLSGNISAQLGNLGKLQALGLLQNQLSGIIPAQLGNLVNLQSLSLGNNQLSGTIPAELGNLGKLQSLSLDHNQLSGIIPAQLGNLVNLQSLSLNSNQLSGSIPAELGNLNRLTEFSLSYNQLSGTIPAQLGNLVNFRVLSLESNKLSGNIPAQLGNLVNLEVLSLQSNQLSGTIPAELGNLGKLTILTLNNNQLSGTIPAQLGNMVNLQMLYLGVNQLSGTIPAQLGNLVNLQRLLLLQNQLSGSIPAQLGNLVNLKELYLFSNKLSGNIPAELGNLSNLQILSLESNQLSGTIPAQLGNLSNLQWLILRNNKLSGEIPASLKNLNKISRLDIDYNCLIATDPTLRTWLNSKDSDWETHQDLCEGITVTFPNGGNELTFGDPLTITWTTSPKVGNVEIEYSIDNGTHWFTIVSSTPNNGSYVWTVPDDNSTNCLIKVSDASDGSPTDTSDAVFSMIIPKIKVKYPNGGETFYEGDPLTITWETTGRVGDVKVEYSTSGVDWIVISPATPNDGSLPWTVPNKPSGFYRIMIREASDGIPQDMNDSWFSVLSPPLKVTSPNGKESWGLGSPQTITWKTTGTVGDVKIEYSIDHGYHWTVIAPTTPNDGSHPWTVPITSPSNYCLVRISEASDGSPTDKSDEVFSIVPTFKVTSPQEGAEWYVGEEKSITWVSTGPFTRVKIEYSTDNGTNWKVIVLSTENDGAYPWTVPAAISKTCKIRISSGTTSDTASFSIAPPKITITSPQKGARWEIGSSQTINWDTKGRVNYVRIKYSPDNGASWRQIENYIPNTGRYSPWIVPYVLSNYCKIKISESPSDSYPAESELFAIFCPLRLTVLTPRKEETWAVGSKQNIYWKVDGPGKVLEVEIKYSLDDGFTWNNIARYLNKGVYSWTVPDKRSTKCKIRISATKSVGSVSPCPMGTSDRSFAIVSAKANTIQVTSPDGRQRWSVGSIHNITWKTTGKVGNVKIELGFIFLGNIYRRVTITNSTKNNGVFSWHVPDIRDDNCRIWISEAADGKPIDYSNGEFTIY
jgi:Leucine-rich repeat (LRR) protein